MTADPCRQTDEHAAAVVAKPVMKRPHRWWRRLALLLAALALAVAAIWFALAGSLAPLQGQRTLAGLSQAAVIERDAAGTVTLTASSEADAWRALGYVHAQERYFEMDLMRRTAAGELSGLLGSRLLDTDRQNRLHRFRARAQRQLPSFAGPRAAALQAYADGVNAGLADLRLRPWPYLLLRQQPAPWRAEDTALVGYAMYVTLQDSAQARERSLAVLQAQLPPPLYALLRHDGSRWDAPLQGEPRGDAVLPAAEVVDLRQLPAPTRPTVPPLDTRGAPGSNNFAVAAALTRDGRAILADDMHARLAVPGLWFRARLRYADAAAPGGQVDVSGFTLPGLPTVIAGSNGHVAWGFTNSYVDSAEWDPPCGDSEEKEQCFVVEDKAVAVETLRVAGGEAITLRVAETPGGPLVDTADGLRRLRWTAYSPEALNLGLAAFNTAASVDEAVAAADGVGLPTANLMLADRHGRIAWRLIGPVLDSPGHRCGPAAPQSCTAVTRRYAIVDPPAQRLWTANNRTLGGDALAAVGDGGYAVGARARQIRDSLFAQQHFDERDLLAIQLDDRALFLQPWWELLQQQAADSASALGRITAAAQDWNGRASVDSVGYRLVRAWRLAVHARIADGLTAPAQAALGERFELPRLPQLESVAWPLVTQQPAHLLSRRYASWQALFEDAAREVDAEQSATGRLAERTWGERNTARICHPLAAAVPLLGRRWLCMPADPLPGDSGMPRVQGPAFGATQRMVVSPGHEGEGFIHMPGGQSGHPLSPFWGSGHADWVQGRPSAFLPAATRYTLTLAPAAEAR